MLNRILLVQLGSTNDENGSVDRDGHLRAEHVVMRLAQLHEAGKDVCILVSGGSDAAFNPTSVPHWSYVTHMLVDLGVPIAQIIQPGLAAMHTVDEAIMTRAHILAHSFSEVIVVTSDFHAARARHLFGVAIGAHAGCDVACRVEEHVGSLTGDELTSRLEMEKQKVATLRTNPFGAWLEFVEAHDLHAANRSFRPSSSCQPPPVV
mmetsp:Transcript_74935/g.124931  ORF Transcript_74935/g.124931 Transcript_74935/m.124931 type:complete len:206 (-) Transcript_74935:417-1034(-)